MVCMEDFHFRDLKWGEKDAFLIANMASLTLFLPFLSVTSSPTTLSCWREWSCMWCVYCTGENQTVSLLSSLTTCTHTHIHVHTDPITHHYHLRNCPTWPFSLSWAVAERPYTSADFWLTGREDTPTWSPFSSSTTPPSPQKPPPTLLFMSQEKTHLSQSVSEQDVSWGEKVSSRVTVHCCDGGCFFTRVWEGAVSLWWEDGGKNKKRRGSEKWKQGLWVFKEVKHGIGRVAVVCVFGAGSGSWVSRAVG